jgi:hypothetical protein
VKKRIDLALGLAAAALCGPALAQTADPAAPVLFCQVQGHDLVVWNRSEGALDAGTVLHWSAWNGRREGDHTLEAPLEPLIGLRLSDALGASYLWDRPCEASVVQRPAS